MTPNLILAKSLCVTCKKFSMVPGSMNQAQMRLLIAGRRCQSVNLPNMAGIQRVTSTAPARNLTMINFEPLGRYTIAHFVITSV